MNLQLFFSEANQFIAFKLGKNQVLVNLEDLDRATKLDSFLEAYYTSETIFLTVGMVR